MWRDGLDREGNAHLDDFIEEAAGETRPEDPSEFAERVAALDGEVG